MKINRPNMYQIIHHKFRHKSNLKKKKNRLGMNYTIRLYQFNSRAMNHSNVIIPTILFRINFHVSVFDVK
jgi:hypothetical protein